MTENRFASPIHQALEFFGRTLSVFEEADSGFAPGPEQFSVAQHVAHVAQTIDWFMAGAFGTRGFDLDFSTHNAEVRAVASLVEAQNWLERAVHDAGQILARKTPEQMMEELPEGPILPREPRAAVVGAICEHTAHHRGSLAVYARLLNRVPPLPYRD